MTEPWYGVLTPEGVVSGDRRMFGEGALRMRSLPLPLNWQKISSEGHKGSVTVAKIEQVWRRNGLVWGSGHALDTPEANEWMELVREFGRFGVSIDADDIDEFAYEITEDGIELFSDARVCAASTVQIPAFPQAFVALGEYTEESREDVPEPSNEIPEFREISDEERDRLVDEGKALPGGSYPIANVEDLRNAIQAIGRAKEPEKVRRHIKKRARELGREDLIPEGWSLRTVVAAAPRPNLPRSWFTDPQLSGITPITVTDEGELFAHVAQWGVCHVGFDGDCIEPPPSNTDYAYFCNGVIETDGGPVNVGNITLGGGHAPDGLRWAPAMRHYDNTCSVVADVACGEDEHGIWVHGAVREGVTDDQIAELKASGGLSGDWREIIRGSDELELIAALAVNVGGFPIPRPAVAASGTHRVSLVAAGAVAGRAETFKKDDLVEVVVKEVMDRTEAIHRTAELNRRLVGNRHETLRNKLREDA